MKLFFININDLSEKIIKYSNDNKLQSNIARKGKINILDILIQQ